MALRLLWSLLIASALLAEPISGVRIVKRKVRTTEAANKTKAAKAARASIIGGVPVHNFRGDATDFMVLFVEGTSDAEIEKFCEGKCDFHGHPDAKGTAFAKVHGVQRLEELVTKHREHIDILEPDEIDHESEGELETPDVELVESWGLGAIGVDSRPTTGRGVHIYVQDTGVHTSHDDFGGRAFAAIDLTSGSLVECVDSSCADDVRGHGTHCAGTAGGKKWGVASDATIHAVKTLGDEGSGARSWQVAAIDWVTSKGQRPAVISMSLGGAGKDQAYARSILAATEAGVVVVVAAGNENQDACSRSPAFVPEAITVGATTMSASRASFSNWGTCNDIMAPGSLILSASASWPGWTSKSGTSMACPHVSGAAALLLEQDPSLGAMGVLDTLERAGKRGTIGDLKESDPDIFLWVGPAPNPAPEMPTSATVKELLAAASTRGMDQAGLRDQLRDLYPDYEWAVLKVESSLVSTWGWSHTGYLIAGDDNLLVLGADCPRPPACGACEQEVKAAFGAIDDSDPGNMRTDLWNALESSNRWNVATAKGGSWNLAWYARPKGQRCMFHGSETTWYGEQRLFVFQLEAAGAFHATEEADAMNASANDTTSLVDLGDSSSADPASGQALEVPAGASLVDAAGEMEVGEASSTSPIDPNSW